MNLLRIAIVSLLLSPGAHAQVTRQPLPAVTPVQRPEPTVTIAPAVETKVRVAAPASPGKISERAPAGAQMGLPAVQSPVQIAKPGAIPIQLTPLDDAMQSESQQFQSISNIQKQKHDAAKNAINNVR